MTGTAVDYHATTPWCGGNGTISFRLSVIETGMFFGVVEYERWWVPVEDIVAMLPLRLAFTAPLPAQRTLER